MSLKSLKDPLDVLHFVPKHLPALDDSANEITFEGRFNPKAKVCWASFPGAFKSGWNSLVSSHLGDCVACVFLCDSESGLGQHTTDPQGDGKKCYCHRIYGERGGDEPDHVGHWHKRFGYLIEVMKNYADCTGDEMTKLKGKAKAMHAVLVFQDDDPTVKEDKEKLARQEFLARGKTAAFGCDWYHLWLQRVRQAVMQKQRLKVVFFPGQVLEGRENMEDLCRADLWNRIGLGTSQKCEVATLEAQVLGFMTGSMTQIDSLTHDKILRVDD